MFKIIKGERGQLLPLAIILLTAGILLVMALLPQLSTMLQSGYKERELAMGRYAAEAGLNRVIADMIRGADAYPTIYTTTSSHDEDDEDYQTFQITTSYTIPSVTVNNYTASVVISLPTESQVKPADQQNYVDPGVIHPDFATVKKDYGYLMRVYNVKAGTIQVNWAYNAAGEAETRVGIWAGIPVDEDTNQPYPPGKINEWPEDGDPLVESEAEDATYNRTLAISVDPATDDSAGVYTIVFYNDDDSDLTTQAFQPSGGTGDTWIYIKAYKDYLVTSTAGGVTVSAYVRQVPGFTEPPAWTSAWAVDNPSWITNEVYIYTWSPP